MQLVSIIVIRWIVIYPVDSAIQRLNNWGQALPSRAQSGDVTGLSRGPTTFMVMCSSIVIVTHLWEYAQVTKDRSPQLATLFPVSC